MHEVSLEIHRASLNVLVGPSGSGKSTLCDLFNGVIPHLYGGKLRGSVRVDGLETSEIQVSQLAHKVGRVFQDPETMFATLYVEDEIAFGPENLRFEVQAIQAIVNEMLELTELDERRHHLVWNLSGGQIQKLGLATVLAMRPELIVLDEPTSNLDPAATRSVHDLVLDLRRQGIAILLVTRELDDFLAEVDQLLVMDGGRIIAAGSPDAVLREYGRTMLDSLGVWLPETTEISLELQELGFPLQGKVPITVGDTVDLILRTVASGPVISPRQDEVRSLPASDGDVLVSARDLNFVYAGGVTALQGVSLEIRDADWLMIVGRNGAGKSTLARLLVGLLKPVDDSLTLFGQDARRWKIQELANQIALVFQNPEHQFLTDSVADEIGYSLLAQGVTNPEERERRIAEMLLLLGLEEVKTIHPFALSAGLKRRLGVATMLVGNPKLLLVDEPTYGQDREMTHTLIDLMRKINQQGVAVVMITHDMRLVQEYAERVVVMSDGRILFEGDASQLFREDEVLQAANLRRTLLHKILEELSSRGFPVEHQIRRTGDLSKLLATRMEAE